MRSEKCPRDNCPRKIAPQKFVPRENTPRNLPPENCPQGNCLPVNCSPKIILWILYVFNFIFIEVFHRKLKLIPLNILIFNNNLFINFFYHCLFPYPNISGFQLNIEI